MGEGSLLLRALHEHRDRRPNALIDEHHEYLVLVAKENCAAAGGLCHRADPNFDNGLTHTCKSRAIRLYAKILVAARIVADPTPVSRVLEQPDVSPDLLLVHQVSDWGSGAAAYFGWMREAKRENTRCGL